MLVQNYTVEQTKKCIGNSPVEIAIQIRAEETLNFHRECAIFDAVCIKFLGRVQ